MDFVLVNLTILHHHQAIGQEPRDGEVVVYQSLKDKAGMLTPNLTTVYAFTFWNQVSTYGYLVTVAGVGVFPT